MVEATELVYPDAMLREILKKVRSIAIVGASQNPARPSFGVMHFLAAYGYSIYAINPGLAGQNIGPAPVYATLAEVPEPIDMIDVFRNSEAAGAVVSESLALKLLPKVIWMQLGVVNRAAAELAQAVGVTVVMDRCPKIEIQRLNL